MVYSSGDDGRSNTGGYLECQSCRYKVGDKQIALPLISYHENSQSTSAAISVSSGRTGCCVVGVWCRDFLHEVAVRLGCRVRACGASAVLCALLRTPGAKSLGPPTACEAERLQ